MIVVADASPLILEHGLLGEVRPVVEGLIAAGMRVSDRLVEEVLRAAGE